MIRNRLRAGLLALIAAALTAAAAVAAPAIRVEPESVDFGNLDQQETSLKEVIVRNAGDEDLVLSEVYSSCPCTLPELDADVVPPGGQTILRINFYSKDLQGLEERVVEIASNDPARPLLEFPVSVYIRAPIFVEPENRSLNFGEVARGETVSKEALLHAQELEALAVTPTMLNRDLFTVSVAPDPGGDPAKAVVRIAVRPEAPAGSFREILRLECSTPGMASIDLELSGKVLSDLRAEPEVANFRFVQPGQALSQTIEVLAEKSPPDFAVTGAQIDLPGLSAAVENQGGGRARVTITGTALPADDALVQSKRGRLKGELKILTNHPEQPELTVKVLYMMRI
jgi:hypothetical protein